MASVIQTFVSALMSYYQTNVSGISTIVQVDKEIDLKKYNQSQLPLLAVQLYTTQYDDQKSQEVLAETPLLVEGYIIDYTEEPTTIQSWIEEVLENTPVVLSAPNNTCVIRLKNSTAEVIETEYPIAGFRLNFSVSSSGTRSDI